MGGGTVVVTAARSTFRRASDAARSTGVLGPPGSNASDSGELGPCLRMTKTESTRPKFAGKMKRIEMK